MVIKANSRLRIAVAAKYDEQANEVTTSSLVFPLAFQDTIDIDFLAPGFPHDIIHYASNSRHIGEKAIIDQALNVMRNYLKIKECFHIKIHKTVPTGYGLGSGASNAWHIMMAIIKMLKLKVTKNELLKIAYEIGHEVSYFATNKIATFNSKTQEIELVKSTIKPYILLIFPRKIVMKEKITEDYVTLLNANKAEESQLNTAEISKINDLKDRLTNDFLSAALKIDDINFLYNDLKKANTPYFGIAGRGTTVFVFSESRSIIRKLREKYRKLGFNALITTLHT
ncbi:MAG TPA: hypothetical protein VFD05_03300 [Bacilli bacterium]|nr:hypothetical protein [Bacilli bacterium]